MWIYSYYTHDRTSNLALLIYPDERKTGKHAKWELLRETRVRTRLLTISSCLMEKKKTSDTKEKTKRRDEKKKQWSRKSPD